MKHLLFFLSLVLFSQTNISGQCTNTDSDSDGVLDCIDPCPNVPSSKIGNLSFESDFIGWTIPQNQSFFKINKDINHVLHGSKSLLVTAPNATIFENHAIYTEEFILEDGVAYNFKIPAKRMGDIDGDALRWALVDQNGVYRTLNNYYNFTSSWSYISINNLLIDYSFYTSNKFRLRLEFGLSTVDMVVDKIEFYETSQGIDPAYLDTDGDGNPDCGNIDVSNHPDYNVLASFYTALNGTTWSNNTNWLDTSKPLSAWYGITETNGRVTGINLSNNNLNGTVTYIVEGLSELETLNLRSNSITGSIPTDLGNLTKLTFIDLAINNLSGEIPKELENLQALDWLDLAYNQLSGSVPSELTTLSNLTRFGLGSNSLGGMLPDFTNQSLYVFTFQDNYFQFGDFENEFDTYQNNIAQLIYAPQKTIGELTEAALEIGSSQTLNTDVSGSQNNYNWYRTNADGSEGGFISSGESLPVTINTTDDYKWYYYYSAASALVPNLVIWSNYYKFSEAPSNSPDYSALVAFYNSTNGDSWNNNTNWLDNTKPLNTWHGVSLENNRVTQLALGGNNLTGTIPPEIGNLTELLRLYLWSNQLTGNIPPEIGNLIKLTYVDLAPNNFSGGIPNEIGNLINLETLWLNQSGLSGTIPASLANLTKLKQLYLMSSIGPGWGDNTSAYSGDFPDLTALPLETLWINNNYFEFTDVADEIDTYKANIPDFKFSPQFTADVPVESNIGIGSDITLTITAASSTSKNMLQKAKLVGNLYQWYKDDVALTVNANSDTYVITNAQEIDSGVYYCEITNPDVPGMIIQRQNITLSVGTLGIEENNLNLVSIYPTPTKNLLNIKLNNQNKADVNLYDISGRIVLKQKLNAKQSTINIKNLNSGIYLLRINTENKSVTKRIIKQ